MTFLAPTIVKDDPLFAMVLIHKGNVSTKKTWEKNYKKIILKARTNYNLDAT